MQAKPNQIGSDSFAENCDTFQMLLILDTLTKNVGDGGLSFSFPGLSSLLK